MGTCLISKMFAVNQDLDASFDLLPGVWPPCSAICRRRRAYAHSSNTSNCDNHEKRNSWVLRIWGSAPAAIQGGFKNRHLNYPREHVRNASDNINCNARTTCVNSGVKPDLGLDQDQQCGI